MEVSSLSYTLCKNMLRRQVTAMKEAAKQYEEECMIV